MLKLVAGLGIMLIMLRFLLSGYLAIFTAIGPCLCCCAISRAAAAIVVHEPGEPPASCCCHNDKSNCKHHQPPKQTPLKSDCPCQQDCSCCGLLPPPANKVAPALAEWLTLLAVALDSPSLEPSAASFERHVQAGQRRHRPFLATSDLLDTQHKLRC